MHFSYPTVAPLTQNYQVLAINHTIEPKRRMGIAYFVEILMRSYERYKPTVCNNCNYSFE